MKNSESPATCGWGLTKLEYACIHCGVPETGDPDLDAIITKGNQQEGGLDDLREKFEQWAVQHSAPQPKETGDQR